MTDVEYDYYIIRTAQKIVNLGEDGVKKHIAEAYEKAAITGFSFNAYMQMSLSDLASAQILVDRGFPDAVLMRMGMWHIGKYAYFTKSNKWSVVNGKTYKAKSLEHFIDTYVVMS